MASNQPLLDPEKESEPDESDYAEPPRRAGFWRRNILLILGLWSFLILSVTMVLGINSLNLHWGHEGVEDASSKSVPEPAGSCAQPTTRWEWRSLSKPEKKQYIKAVQCLKAHPSRLGLNHTLYDDFPWVHYKIGGYCAWNCPLTLCSAGGF